MNTKKYTLDQLVKNEPSNKKLKALTERKLTKSLFGEPTCITPMAELLDEYSVDTDKVLRTMLGESGYGALRRAVYTLKQSIKKVEGIKGGHYFLKVKDGQYWLEHGLTFGEK